jgi:GT2 family glycosyltransferase
MASQNSHPAESAFERSASLAEGAQTPILLAVLVLYRLGPLESPAFVTLTSAIRDTGTSGVACLLYDNSPVSHDVPAVSFSCTYLHNPSNPGLAAAYQAGLDRARQSGIPWLLLLDQDTKLTASYLEDLLIAVRTLAGKEEVAAIVPRLLQDDIVLSPHWPHGVTKTQSFRNHSGLVDESSCIYNSGALLRVQSLEELGGFPQAFPLDYLDHAVFRQLHAHGKRVYLLSADIEHHLASKLQDIASELNSSPRLRSMLSAESRFYRQYGTQRERMLLLRRRASMGLTMLSRMEFRSLLWLFRCSV